MHENNINGFIPSEENNKPNENTYIENNQKEDTANSHADEYENFARDMDEIHSENDFEKTDYSEQSYVEPQQDDMYHSYENESFHQFNYNKQNEQSGKYENYPVTQPVNDYRPRQYSGYNNPYQNSGFSGNANGNGNPYNSDGFNTQHPNINDPANPADPMFNNPTAQQTKTKIKKEKKKKERKPLTVRSAAVLVAICVLLSGLCGVGGAYVTNKYQQKKGTASSSLVINKIERDYKEASEATAPADLSTAEITGLAADSVVEIITESVATGSFMQQYITSGAGSGVIISDDGYIISNNHVIEGATSISVTLRNGESYDAKLIGYDQTQDVSLIKIDAKDLTPAVFGDSDKIKVGDTAVAIGNPLGQLGGTVTTGIISALDRDIDIEGVTMNLLQTNAAINPGNSGGGLFNGQGELIGLVVAKSSGSDVEGLGFAIPINDVSDILEDLMEYGYVRGRIYLGMSLIDINTKQMAAMYGLSETGVYVNTVDSSSAAYKAGIQSADRITTVGGKEVSSIEEIEEIIDEYEVGDVVSFGIERTSRIGKKTTGTVDVTLEEYIPSLSDRVNNNTAPNQGNGNDNGSYYDDWDDIFGDIFGDFFG
ncbi:MAG: trypsin-like peptidase domain-containing protein [Clostridia bacterium]|nr:trypsin-like peptidase domain-containing protein [Clostridia bacterium]